MIKLSLERINAKSPYEVSEAGGGYEFRTEGGILYRIRFLQENPIGGCDTYQFAISKIDNVRSPHDPNISAITFIILDEFFTEYENVLLYYCDSSDHREAGRNRLFIRWFEKAASPNRFTIRTTHATLEGRALSFTLHLLWHRFCYPMKLYSFVYQHFAICTRNHQPIPNGMGWHMAV